MEYTLKLKKVYKDKKDVDQWYPENRSGDVELRNIENNDATYPMSRQKLTDAINLYTSLLKSLDKTMEEVSATVEVLKKENDSMKEDGTNYGEQIAEIQERLTALSTLYSNVSSTVGEQATEIAQLSTQFGMLSNNFTNLDTKVTLERELVDARLKELEKVSLVPVSQEQIMSLFDKQE